MSVRARKTFERVVVAAALALPLLALLAASGSGAGGAVVTPAAGASGSLSYRTSWIGNTWGYGDRRWMQIDVQALAVAPDGDVFTNAPWDESGGELGQYRDGDLVRHGGDSHGWGMMGGDAIALNDDYVYAAQTIVSLGNEEAKHRPTPPEGEVWSGVSRRSRADIREGVPFAGQLKFPGGSRLAFLRIARYAAKTDYAIRGLAADNSRLFVANPLDNRVQVFDARTMQPVAGFAVREPGRIALASDGSLWLIENSRGAAAPHVVHRSRDGARLGELALPSDAVAVDLTVDARGRVLIADNGVRQQILIYSAAPASGTDKASGAMQLTATFGERGGIYAGRAGMPGPRRFNGLTGIGVDHAGNLYVSMNGAGPRPRSAPDTYDGALLESYAPDGRRRFSLQALLFVDGAQFVDGEPPSVYSGSKRFTLDLTRGPGDEWTYAGYTADRFRYPWDPYFHLWLGGQRGMPMVRDVQGHRLLYTTDMYSAYLRIYRFVAGRETAIPAGLFALTHIDGAWPPGQPPHGEWIWRDASGRGDFSAAAFEQSASGGDAPPLRGWWVDSRGDVWQATQTDGIRRFSLQGFDKRGNPVYRYTALREYPMPAPFNHLARLQYSAADDTMYLSGSTPAQPFNQLNWNGAGSRLARYDHWHSATPTLRYLIEWPDVSGSEPSGSEPGGSEPLLISGFALAGDYLFAVEGRRARVRVYDQASGCEVGQLAPGKEVGSTSGWTDVPMPITAHRLASGEYLVFVEEDARGKVLMYRFTPS
ncbi:hypothetical protein LJ656_01405 [Paraburkholderia sp. MMS20-SJTR3]|uniref:NHL repeat-containing protein n=1 Tax=Paraburkholderia sejongensis TaxID=2886946 RepID=A0ABS8JMV7_9BURK|nr:hypothetical protein [Paraburkholderia sp. MMS20-SJTR3]MCC8391231.1 hypothetical protein [Paraburkholderia sp. MMS20-SJTR3]